MLTLCKLCYFFSFRWVWDGFCRAFLIRRLVLLHKEWKGRQLRLAPGQSQQKKTAKNSHFYVSYGNHLHRPNSQDIWPHSFEKSSWSNKLYYLICALEIVVELIFGFPHIIQTNVSVLFRHLISQSLPRDHTQGKF